MIQTAFFFLSHFDIKGVESENNDEGYKDIF